MFTSDDIQKRVRQRPFVPLRVVTSAGQMFDLYHPDLIMVGTREVTVGRASTANPTQYDQLTRVAILHIASLEGLPAPSMSEADGEQ